MSSSLRKLTDRTSLDLELVSRHTTHDRTNIYETLWALKDIDEAAYSRTTSKYKKELCKIFPLSFIPTSTAILFIFVALLTFSDPKTDKKPDLTEEEHINGPSLCAAMLLWLLLVETPALGLAERLSSLISEDFASSSYKSYWNRFITAICSSLLAFILITIPALYQSDKLFKFLLQEKEQLKVAEILLKKAKPAAPLCYINNLLFSLCYSQGINKSLIFSNSVVIVLALLVIYNCDMYEEISLKEELLSIGLVVYNLACFVTTALVVLYRSRIHFTEPETGFFLENFVPEQIDNLSSTFGAFLRELPTFLLFCSCLNLEKNNYSFFLGFLFFYKLWSLGIAAGYRSRLNSLVGQLRVKAAKGLYVLFSRNHFLVVVGANFCLVLLIGLFSLLKEEINRKEYFLIILLCVVTPLALIPILQTSLRTLSKKLAWMELKLVIGSLLLPSLGFFFIFLFFSMEKREKPAILVFIVSLWFELLYNSWLVSVEDWTELKHFKSLYIPHKEDSPISDQHQSFDSEIMSEEGMIELKET